MKIEVLTNDWSNVKISEEYNKLSSKTPGSLPVASRQIYHDRRYTRKCDLTLSVI